MSYTGLLRKARKEIRGFSEGGLTAADEGTRRLSSKGLTSSSFQEALGDNDASELLPKRMSSGSSLVKRRASDRFDSSESEEDFLTRVYKEVVNQNKKLVGEGSSTQAATDESGEPLDILNQGDDIVERAANNSVPRFNTELSGFKALLNDEAFMRELEELKKEFPTIQNNELFNVIFKESSFNPTAKSAANAAGLLQMMPEVLGEMGLTTEEVLSMDPADQLIVYKGYLKRWGYDGSSSLGVLQAAPAYRNADPSTVIYRKGSKQANMNPGWQDANGNVTKESIDNFYRGAN